MSRSSVGWGIPLPWDDKQVVYVWFDALLNYITAIGYGTDAPEFDEIWPATCNWWARTSCGFHAVYWPAMLMAAGSPAGEGLRARMAARGWREDEQEQAHGDLPGPDRGRLRL